MEWLQWSGCQELVEGLHTVPKKMETATEPFPVTRHGYPACERRLLCQYIMQDIHILLGVQFDQMEGELWLAQSADLFWPYVQFIHEQAMSFLTLKAIWIIDKFPIFLIFKWLLTWTQCVRI